MDLIEKYRLTKEENLKIGNKIIDANIIGKQVLDEPIAIFTIGAPGSGKTALNGYTSKQMNGNIVIVNNDEYRHFHPKAKEIANLYPDDYIKITNEESKIWTDNLVDELILRNINFLYEGTGRKLSIYKRMFDKLKNYKKIVRVLAVSDLNCLMSIYARYNGQVKTKGYGRLVSKDTFYKSYDGEMIENLKIIEENNLVDQIEVYMRGDNIFEPVQIYDSRKREFTGVEEAIIFARKKDYKKAIEQYKKEFSNQFQNGNSEAEKEIIYMIKNLVKIEKERE